MYRGFPGGSDGKESAVWETWVQSLGLKDPLEKEVATYSSILAWTIQWTEEPGAGYSPWGRKESDMTERLTHTHTHTHTHSHTHTASSHAVPLASASLDSSFPLYNTVKSHTFESSHCKLSKM